MLARIALDKDYRVTFMAYANPAYGRYVGQVDDSEGTTVYEVQDDEWKNVNHAHAFFKDGHLTQDPDWDPADDMPIGPDPIDYSSIVVDLTEKLADSMADNTALSESVAQLTDFVASMAAKEE